MIKIEINNIEFLVKSGISVLEACKFVGIYIPRFCYHEMLSVAGNCRMCVIELFNSPKPVASCAMPVLNGMKIFVDTPLVKKARENVLETLLINHPLDCPICDQGGECDLQDQAKAFGTDYSRYFFNKRGIEDKRISPLIKTIMTRCIHCTRCVRFNAEISGEEFLGTLNRGKNTEIGGYVGNLFKSEISGTVVDLCPVGALTSKPYSFKARSWELRSVESIDLSDSLGSNINVNFKETEIVRVFPKTNFDINESLISDKARYLYDGNKNQRLTNIYFKEKNKYLNKNWDETLILLEKFINEKINFVVNNDIDFESICYLRKLEYKLKNSVNKIISYVDVKNKSNLFVSWLSNKLIDIKTVENKLCLIISSNLRAENALLNTKIRLKYFNEDLTVVASSQFFNSNFPIQFINLSSKSFIKMLEAKNPSFSMIFINNKSPLICLGESLLKRGFCLTLIRNFFVSLMPTAIIFDLKSGSNSVCLDFFRVSPISRHSFVNQNNIFLINSVDNTVLDKLFINYNIIYAGTHGGEILNKANIDLFQ
jgi:NADH-quinone oxidoreductase chain G